MRSNNDETEWKSTSGCQWGSVFEGVCLHTSSINMSCIYIVECGLRVEVCLHILCIDNPLSAFDHLLTWADIWPLSDSCLCCWGNIATSDWPFHRSLWPPADPSSGLIAQHVWVCVLWVWIWVWLWLWDG